MLTVVMCTHNGSDTIDRTLEAFCQLHSPPGGWRLVIVDNASTDSTPEIIHGYASKLPLTIIQEPRPGQTHAQNTGIANVEGDLTIFTDDDILPIVDWLVQWRHIANRYPDIDIFGGAIEPEFEVSPPNFITHSPWMSMLYAITDPIQLEGPVAPHSATIFGPNMAFRSTLLQRGHRFDSRLMAGPVALLGNETDFIDRAVAGGSTIGFAPAARVRHIVNKSQITWRWILFRFYRHGRTMYFMQNVHKKENYPEIFGMPRFLVRRLLERTISLPLISLTFNRGKIMGHLRLMAYDLGAMRQARDMATHSP